MEALRDWAKRTVGMGAEPEEAAPMGNGHAHDQSIPEEPVDAAITVEQVLADESIPDLMREWLLAYVNGGTEWAVANNPPSFVEDEGCWEKAKRAAEHAEATDGYAFANYWYHLNC